MGGGGARRCARCKDSVRRICLGEGGWGIFLFRLGVCRRGGRGEIG